MKYILFALILLPQLSYAKKVAIVKMMRGEVSVTNAGASKPIKKGEWVNEGDIIKTEAKSFAKLSFVDKSTMTVGPKSQMKIEKFSKQDPGVINVIGGKIRSKVSKDYLNMDRDKSKLFVKSKSAVMGIRGTDFMFSVNPNNNSSTAVLFEGSVVFNKIDPGQSTRDLESIVNKGERIRPGQFSVVSDKVKRPTVPAKMNSSQLKALEKNENFEVIKPKEKKQAKSVVPPGLSGEVTSASKEDIEVEVSKVVGDISKVKKVEAEPVDIEQTKGFVDGDKVKPADGSIVHIDSGTVIPIGKDSQFDPNTNEWVSTSSGSISATGDYVPPENFAITDDGNLLKKDLNSGKIVEVVVDIKPIDQVGSLNEMPVKEFKPVASMNFENLGDDFKVNTAVAESTEQSVTGSDPVANTTNANNQVDATNAPIAENTNTLAPPPVCNGGCQQFVPPTWQVSGTPEEVKQQTERIRQRTRTRFRLRSN